MGNKSNAPKLNRRRQQRALKKELALHMHKIIAREAGTHQLKKWVREEEECFSENSFTQFVSKNNNNFNVSSSNRRAARRRGEDVTELRRPSRKAVKKARTGQDENSACSASTRRKRRNISSSTSSTESSDNVVPEFIPCNDFRNQESTMAPIASEPHYLGLCRCCLVQVSFKRCQYGNTSGELTDTYADMLLTTFGITVTQVEKHSVNTPTMICSDCKTRLQNSFAFKQQVIAADKMFVEKIESGLLGVFDVKKADRPDVKHILVTIEGYNYKSEIKDENDDRYESDRLHDAAVPKKATKSGLELKQKTKPTVDESGIKCEICGKMEDNCMMMSYHVKRDHHWCAKCGKMFRNKYERIDHEQTHPRVCEMCKEEFETNLLLRSHMIEAHKTKKFHKCADCGEVSVTYLKLLKHKADTHGAPQFTCGACHKVFYVEARLSTHHRLHHMMERNYPCNKCEYKASSAGHLKDHMVCHTTVKHFECGYCHKKFARSKTLLCHERIHTGDKRQVCRLCGAAFVQRASLKYHLEKQHPGEV